MLLIAWLLRFSSGASGRKPLILIPLLMVNGELCENSLLYLAASTFPVAPNGLEILPLVSFLKFSGLALTQLVAAALAIVSLINRIGVDAWIEPHQGQLFIAAAERADSGNLCGPAGDQLQPTR